MSAIRALLEGIVDYAGLYPPAALDMRTAVANYRQYRLGDAAWMLGRFVVPAARLEEFDAALGDTTESAAAWALSAIVGDDIAADVDRVQAFNARAPEGRRVDTLEARLSTPDAITRGADAARVGFSVYAEIPVADDPVSLVAALARAGINAKVRTGGLTADAFPAADHLVRFMDRCIRAGVPFKATAGLHHPICAEYPLTYASNAPRGPMYGYLNLFLAAAALRCGADARDAAALLLERDARAFTVDDESIAWHGMTFRSSDLAAAREHSAVAFGSCSFREPVDELRALGFSA